MNILETIKNNKKVLVDFYADWCGPCKKMLPVIDQLKTELSNDIEIIKVNIDENEDLAINFGVMSVPTFLFFKDGDEFERVSGVISKSDIISIFK